MHKSHIEIPRHRNVNELPKIRLILSYRDVIVFQNVIFIQYIQIFRGFLKLFLHENL